MSLPSVEKIRNCINDLHAKKFCVTSGSVCSNLKQLYPEFRRINNNELKKHISPIIESLTVTDSNSMLTDMYTKLKATEQCPLETKKKKQKVDILRQNMHKDGFIVKKKFSSKEVDKLQKYDCSGNRSEDATDKESNFNIDPAVRKTIQMLTKRIFKNKIKLVVDHMFDSKVQEQVKLLFKKLNRNTSKYPSDTLLQFFKSEIENQIILEIEKNVENQVFCLKMKEGATPITSSEKSFISSKSSSKCKTDTFTSVPIKKSDSSETSPHKKIIACDSLPFEDLEAVLPKNTETMEATFFKKPETTEATFFEKPEIVGSTFPKKPETTEATLIEKPETMVATLFSKPETMETTLFKKPEPMEATFFKETKTLEATSLKETDAFEILSFRERNSKTKKHKFEDYENKNDNCLESNELLCSNENKRPDSFQNTSTLSEQTLKEISFDREHGTSDFEKESFDSLSVSSDNSLQIIDLKKFDPTPTYFKPKKEDFFFDLYAAEDLPTFSSFSGLESFKEKLKEWVIEPLKRANALKNVKIPVGRGVLIYGKEGSGKTTLALATAGELATPVYVLNSTEVHIYEFKVIEYFFDLAINESPGIMIIKNIDQICNAAWDNRLKNKYTQCISDCMSKIANSSTVIIATAVSNLDLSEKLLQNGKFDFQLNLGDIGSRSRKKILQGLSLNSKEQKNDIDFNAIVRRMKKATIRDIKVLVRNAFFANLKRTSYLKFDNEDNLLHEPGAYDRPKLCQIDFEEALKNLKPLPNSKYVYNIPKVSWNDIGGLDDQRNSLEVLIVRALKHSKVYEICGIETASSVLLYGPPGCGKTLIAQATAASCKVNFMFVKGPELLNKYVGESEFNVRKIFADARNAAPCLIFFDEFDALCQKREDSGCRTFDNVVNQFLSEMDGVSGKSGIFIIAATNRPEKIDPAILRPGRFETKIYIPLPNYHMRLQVLRSLKSKYPLDDNLDLSFFAEKTEGFSGADLAGVVKKAAMKLATEFIEQKNKAQIQLKITHQYLIAVLDTTSPSVSREELAKYEKIHKLMTKNI